MLTAETQMTVPSQDHPSLFFHLHMGSKVCWARIFLAIFMCITYTGSWWQMGIREKIQTSLVPGGLFLTLMLRKLFVFLLFHLPLIHLEKNSYPEIHLHSTGQGKGSPSQTTFNTDSLRYTIIVTVILKSVNSLDFKSTDYFAMPYLPLRKWCRWPEFSSFLLIFQ